MDAASAHSGLASLPRSPRLTDFDDDDTSRGGKDSPKSLSLHSLPGLTDSSSVESGLESPHEHPDANADTFFTPQNYRNAKPLQAAFMSTGLISKRGRPRSSSNSFNASFDSTIPENTTFDTTANTAQQIEDNIPQNRILPHPAVTALGGKTRRPSIPPNTPCKRAMAIPISCAPKRLPNVHVDPPSDPLDAPPSTNHKHSSHQSSYFSSSSPTPWNASPHQSPSIFVKSTKLSTPKIADDSGYADLSLATRFQSIHPSPSHASPSSPSPSVRSVKPLLFRRRSSGNLPLTLDKTSRKRSGDGDWDSGEPEPKTPTRFLDNQEEFQLVASPPKYEKPPSSTNTNVESEPARTTEFFATPKHYNKLIRPLQSAFSSASRFRHRRVASTASPINNELVLDRFEEKFTLDRLLDSGEFSDVYSVIERESGNVYAVKRTKLPYSGPKNRLRRLEEVDALRQVSKDGDCPYVVKLYDAWEGLGHLYIRTELCSHGNLAKFLDDWGSEHGTLDEARVWKILCELAQGLSHIHSSGIIHLDLKPANVFITAKGSLQIGDFGLATRWPRGSAVSILRGAAIDLDGYSGDNDSEGFWFAEGLDTRRGRCKSWGGLSTELEREGDREYIAGEVLAGRYGPEADVFSLGLIILEAASNVILPDNGLPWRKLRSNDLSDVNLEVTSDLALLIMGMMEKNPDRRLAIKTICEHPTVKVVRELQAKSLASRISTTAFHDEFDLSVKGAVVPEPSSFLDDIMLLSSSSIGEFAQSPCPSPRLSPIPRVADHFMDLDF